jgi:hypothetical protein
VNTDRLDQGLKVAEDNLKKDLRGKNYFILLFEIARILIE